MKFFIIFLIHILESINFTMSIILKILCISMFLIIAFRKRFKNVMPIFSLNFVVRNTNLEHDF